MKPCSRNAFGKVTLATGLAIPPIPVLVKWKHASGHPDGRWRFSLYCKSRKPCWESVYLCGIKNRLDCTSSIQQEFCPKCPRCWIFPHPGQPAKVSAWLPEGGQAIGFH